MSKLPDFIKTGIDEIDVWAVDLSAVRHKLNTSAWSEEAEPVDVSDAELIALLEEAVARGVNNDEARFLGMMLAEAPAEQIPALRLAYAHLLATSPRAKDSYAEDIHLAAGRLSSAILLGRSGAHKVELAARFDWPTIAKRNSDRRAEDAERRRQEEVKREAARCWNGRLAPTSDEVRAEMIAYQHRERERLRYEDDDEERPRAEDDIRLALARRGYGYDDGDFFVDRYKAIPEILARQRAARRQAILDNSAFDEDEGNGPILDYYDPDTGLLPAYPNGGILEVIGPAQNYKTTLVARLCCAAMARNRDLSVLYMAGELPAHVRSLRKSYGAEVGLIEGDTKARFHVHNGMPAMHEPENADRVLEMVKTLGVNIVVLDTWARAIAGLREISDAPGDMLTEAGEIGRIAALGVLVIIVGHCPLSQEKRLRGNSSADNAGDARLWVIGSARGFKVEVLKMRPVPPGHTVYGSVPPVPRNLSPQERAALPPPAITWCEKAEYDKAVHDPRQRGEQTASEPTVTTPAGRKRPMTSAERKRRQRQRKQEPKSW